MFRAISLAEYKDFEKEKIFKTSRNTLEVKQFFRSKKLVLNYVKKVTEQRYSPPYKYIMEFDIDIAHSDELELE